MTIMEPEQQVARHEHPPARDSLGRLFALGQHIDKSVAAVTSGGVDPLLSEVVERAIAAFVQTGEPHAAADSLAPLLRQIGHRQARQGQDADDLALSFRTASNAAQNGLALAVGDRMPGDLLARLRTDLVDYMRHLFGHTKAGLDHTRHLLAMAESDRAQCLRSAIFGGGPLDSIDTLAELCGWDPECPMVPLVSATVLLPETLLASKEVLRGYKSTEVVVPVTWGAMEVTARIEGHAALGPPVLLRDMPESLRLARKAAQLVAGGTQGGVPRVVYCTELLTDLLVNASPLLTQLLVNKHLRELERLPLARRLGLAETLLLWLESGLPVNRVARAQGIPTQTAHSRVAAAKKILGDDLDRADTRVELLFALRAALPAWRTVA